MNFLNKLTFKLATIRQIPVFIHWSMTIYLLFCMMGGSKQLMFCGVLYGTVLLHEFGHSFMAQYCKVTVPKITMYPFGGAASISNWKTTKKEFLITIAGPMVNVILALITWGIMCSGYSGEMLKLFLRVNICLFVFNMLPVYPMDGGRIFKTSLEFFKVRPSKIRNITFYTTKVFAGLFILLGVCGVGPFIIIVGVFLMIMPKSTLQINNRRV